MKTRIGIAIYVMFFATAGFATLASAHETKAEVGQQPAQSTMTAASNVEVAPALSWAPSNGRPAAHKTRAQVYQELVQSERSGEMQYLDSTIFGGG